MLDDMLKEIELHKDEIEKDYKVTLNDMNKTFEKNKFTVNEYMVISDTTVKFSGSELLEAYREYNNWDRQDKNIIYARVEKGYFMDTLWIIDHEVIKVIK